MDKDFDIAIVGMSCRFPGARNSGEFWHNLAGGVESIARLSDQEILESGVPASYLGNPSYVKAAPVLEQPGAFAAAFFGFSPMEARTMDPQHRILLELAHEALEDAGCDPERYRGRTGVFTGAAMNTYFTASRLNRRLAEDYIPTLIVNDKDFLSTRISYKLNLKGPSMTVQTACSTSLVAIHLARQSLLSGETDMALAGAVSVRVPHRAGYFADAGGVSSPDGRIRAFDARANGTVFGSGGGIVVLKRLADAIEAGDTIHAVIKGSAVNNDGAEKAGYTAPGVNSQADCVVEALANAGIEADSVSYIEAHGSGTPVGDPIEIAALTKAFRASTGRSGYCAIGSVKTNIGHLDAAAGIAGLIKTVLALKHRQIPATLHYSEPNPEIDFPSTPFYVNSRLAPWTSTGPRRAGIMSTGMGGTNAHVVLEEAPARAQGVASGAPHLLVLSARTATALDSATARLLGFLEADASANMDDVAFTLQAGRRNFPHRRFLVCSERADAIAGLAANSKRLVSSQARGSRRPLILLLPGVGDHFVGMAHDLYGHFDVFRNEVDRCAQILEPRLGVDIRKIIYPQSESWKSKGGQRAGIDLKKMLAGKSAESEDADSKALNRTAHAQPALFAVEYALAKLWIDLGVVPDAIVGHSMGEYVAACLAGVLSLEDALRLIVRRTQLVDQLPGGRMLAVALSEEEVLAQLTSGLSICLINGPKLCVVAGATEAADEFERALCAKGVICRPVQNTHAFHSRMLDPVVGAFEDEVRKVRLNEPGIPYVSNVTGTWVTKAQAMDPAYWASHTNHTARFNDALRTLWQLGDEPILLEAGPGKTLGVLAMQHPDRKSAGKPAAFSSLRHHYENRDDVEVLLHAAGGLWASGVEIRWDGLHQGKPRRKVALPAYPFERQEYWFERDAPASQERATGSAEPESAGIDGWFYAPTWERAPDAGALGYPAPEQAESWLVFTDRWGGGTAFRRMLEGRGTRIHVARFGRGFRRGQGGSYEIDPSHAGDYLSLFREIKGTIAGRLNIVHLGCLTPDGERGDCASISRNQDFGFFSLLYIAQAIAGSGISAPVRIGIVSNRVHEVTGDEALDPQMATVLGASKVIPHEFPNIACFNVDLPGPRVADDLADEVMARILAEFAEQGQGDVIAYRGRHRWRRKYQRVDLPAAPAAKRLRQRGVYLITGGTGGLGLAFAKYLARTCQARIVLTKKTPFPEKSQWKGLLNSKEVPGAIVATIQEILEVERLGGEVEVFVAEASDRSQMQRVVDGTLARFGAIHGVFHAAGIVRPRLIRSMTKATVEGVLAPKVQGTLVLIDLLKDVGLDFLVLFSSMSSITGAYAHCDYAAANSFLDAVASYSNSRSRFHTLAINWPVWREVGIGAGGSYFAQLEALLEVQDLQEEMLKRAILTHEGLEAFARALSSDLPQIVVSPEHLGSLIDRSKPAPAARRSHPGAPGPDQAMPLDSGADQAADDIEAEVGRIWKAVFGHEQIGLHEDFSDLGGHSLIAMQIVARVRSFYQIDLSLRDFFATPTIARLSSEIEARILREIDSLSDDEAGRIVQTISADRVS